MEKIYFFDSYALFEIILGNLRYSLYTESSIVITKLNVFEVYYSLLRDMSENDAEKFLEEYYKFVIDFNEEDIKKAAKFKLENKKRNLSMTDCIGYVLAKRLGTKFLTGDKEFINLDNVEFVK